MRNPTARGAQVRPVTARTYETKTPMRQCRTQEDLDAYADTGGVQVDYNGFTGEIDIRPKGSISIVDMHR